MKCEGLNDPRGLGDDSVEEKHVRSLSLQKVILSLENASKGSFLYYSKTRLKQPPPKRPKFGFQDRLLLNARCIKLPSVLKTFILSILRGCLRQVLLYYNAAQRHEGFVVFHNAFSRAKTYILLISVQFYVLTVDDVNFCDGLS